MHYNKFLKLISILTVLVIGTNCAFSQISNEAKVEYNRGNDYYQNAQYDKAIECFKNATELDPNYIDAYFNLGALLEYIHDYDGALNAFKQIILRKPDDYEAVYKAAEISKNIGNIDKMNMYLSIIPEDSLFGPRAKALAKSVDSNYIPKEPPITNNEAPQTEQPKENSIKNKIGNDLFKEENISFTNGVYTDIASPTGITTDKQGNLYVAGFSDNTIYKITPDGKKIVFIKNPKIDGPIGLEIDNNGNIYIANYNKNNVLKADISGNVTEIITDVINPYCMHIDNGVLFVSSQGSNSVVRYRLFE